MASLKKRVGDLVQALSPEPVGKVVGWLSDDGQSVSISGTDVQMSLAEFEERYPNRLLIVINYVSRDDVPGLYPSQ